MANIVLREIYSYSLLINTQVSQKVLPINFVVVNGSVLQIGVDMHWTFTYRQEKLCIYLYQFVFNCDVRSKERFSKPETVKNILKYMRANNAHRLKDLSVICSV